MSEKIKEIEDCLLELTSQKGDDTFGLDIHSVIAGIRVSPGISEDELWKHYAKSCADYSVKNPAWSNLAGKIMVRWLSRQNPYTFSEFTQKGCGPKGLQQSYANFVLENEDYLNKLTDSILDIFDFAGVCTLLQSYLYRIKTEKGEVLETPSQMYMRVCCFLHAPDLGNITELYNLLIQKKASFSSPVYFNSATRRASLFACFKAGTKVLTQDGAVDIEKVQIGQKVITHTGSWNSVQQIHKNPLGDRNMVNLKVFKSRAVSVTENHEFLAIQRYGDGIPRWTPVEFLWKGDLIALPPTNISDKKYEDVVWDMMNFLGDGLVASETKHKHHLKIRSVVNDKKCNTLSSRYIHCDEDFMMFLGCWYGGGNIMMSKGKNVGIRLVADSVNESLIKKWAELGKKIFGVTLSISYNASGMISCDVCSSVVGNFFEKTFGKGFNGKIIPKELYKCSGSEIYNLNVGLVCTDGCWTTKNIVVLQMSNVKFMTQLYYLLRSFGIEALVGKERMAKGGTKMHVMLTYPSDYIDPADIISYKHYDDERLKMDFVRGIKKNNKRMVEVNGQRFVRIDKKDFDYSDKPEFVYTLGVENDHSYCVEGIIAKNCFLNKVEDSIPGISESWKETAIISMNKGGIGIGVSSLRHSEIGATGRTSRGILPWLKILNEITNAVDQGSVRRGSSTVFLRDFHVDLEEFCELRKASGPESMRTRELNLAVMLSDLFMERVRDDKKWSLMCIAEGQSVNLSDGTSRPIEEITEGMNVLCRGKPTEFEGIESRKVIATSKNRKECLELIFADGRTLICTHDHKILTSEGIWVEAGDLQVGKSKVRTTIEYPKFSNNDAVSDWSLNTSLETFNASPNGMKRIQAFSRIFGYLLTDGHVGKRANGGVRTSEVDVRHKLDVKSIQDDIELLTNKKANFSKKNNTYRYFYH